MAARGASKFRGGASAAPPPGPPTGPGSVGPFSIGARGALKFRGGASAAPVEGWLVSPPAAPHTAAPGPPTGPGSVGPFSMGARGALKFRGERAPLSLRVGSSHLRLRLTLRPRAPPPALAASVRSQSVLAEQYGEGHRPSLRRLRAFSGSVAAARRR